MPLAKTVYRLLLPYKGNGLKTMTTDNGSEFAEHEWITKKLGMPVFFTDSYSSWQKGAIENTNKLIRQYIPKGTDISSVPEKKIANFNTCERVFQKLFVILHLLVDSLRSDYSTTSPHFCLPTCILRASIRSSFDFSVSSLDFNVFSFALRRRSLDNLMKNGADLAHH